MNLFIMKPILKANLVRNRDPTFSTRPLRDPSRPLTLKGRDGTGQQMRIKGRDGSKPLPALNP